MSNIINNIKNAITRFIEYVKSLIEFIEGKIGRKAFIAIVVLLVILIGVIIFLTRPKYLYQETGKEDVPVLTNDDAKSIVDSVLVNLLNVYENPKEVFEVEEIYEEEKEEEKKEEAQPEEPEIIDDYTGEETEEKEEKVKVPSKYVIKDYSKKMKSIFTSDGKTEFEKMTFNGKKFYEKEEDKIYFNTSIVSKENKFSGDPYTITQLVMADGEISCKLHFSRLSINENDEVSYAVYTKSINIIKTIDGWLVSSFKYTIEK